MPDHFEREKELFSQAVDLPSAEARQAFLKEACGGDHGMCQKIEALVEAFHSADGFIPTRDAAESPSDIRTATLEQPGDQIGRYKLLEKLGEGGFGVVYMAEQREPVKRRVALKIIKVGMDTREVVARFEAERQALALMDHPNIAKVYDGGITEQRIEGRSQRTEIRNQRSEIGSQTPAGMPVTAPLTSDLRPLTSASGRPYFVMELVRGIRITEYCDQNQLGLEERLKLFMQVCHAVQHAHQKGIIHRDLKPSNILVTLHDGVPVPKVIDFGIAKATQQELTEKTLFTQFHQFIGTPSYMSPEQAELSGLDIDTRSDIYSLGVLLYELLAGKPPFDGQELLKAGLDEMRRTLREVEPPRPSTRLKRERSSNPDLPPNPQSAIDPDLDWIVMKCLEKDRTRRYDTANGLAADIQRHLGNEPIVARPPSAAYRFQKSIRRNKLAFASGAMVFIALVAGLASASWMYWQKQGALSRALSAEQAAKAEAATSKKVTKAMSEMLKIVEPARAKGRDTTLVREMVDETVQRLRATLTNEPLVEAELRNNLAWAYWKMEEYERQEEMGREIMRLVEPVKGRKGLFRLGLNWQGTALSDLGRYKEAEANFRELAAGPDDSVATLAHRNMISVLIRQGRWNEAESWAEQTQAKYVKYTGEKAPQVVNDVAEIRYNCGDYEAADALGQQALALSRKVFGETGGGACERSILWQLGATALRRNDFVVAEDYLRRVTNALSTYYKEPSLDSVANDLAELYYRQARYSESEALYREILARQQAHLKHGNDRIVETAIGLARTLSAWAGAGRGKIGSASLAGFSATAEPHVVAVESNDIRPVPLASPRQHAIEAEHLLRGGLSARLKSIPDSDWRNNETRSLLGFALAVVAVTDHALNQPARTLKLLEGEALVTTANDALQRNASVPYHSKRDALDRLIRFYEEWDALSPNTEKAAKAAEWKQALRIIDERRPKNQVSPNLEARK